MREHLPISRPDLLAGDFWLLRLDLYFYLADFLANCLPRDLEDAAESLECQCLCVYSDGTLVPHFWAYCAVLRLDPSPAVGDGIPAVGDGAVDRLLAAKRRYSARCARTFVRGGGKSGDGCDGTFINEK